MANLDRNQRRRQVHRRVRKKVRGSSERPRIAIYRSLQHVYAQAIDDDAGVTLAQASTTEKDMRAGGQGGANTTAARAVGELIGRRLKERGIERAVLDRGGYIYHGRVKAVADGARSSGIQV